ncbi:hypothetical protein F5J12DRAFT_13861 [Pisolithus orientalis]|uniref:uncharacterized protein n=1 Tax=Pisolithus orientalis TaxID=936130 RepID=UPI002225AB09|nr:uncharacterized protein F5J12DRAFT_13861 [Pisolithus orientalis]KAI6035175.1 hypothetical protein F5J12DRAFT_13861 [Pisolithus orientalis]
MSQSDRGRHSMSRRKPVPKFIPSPPPSPPSSPGAPFGQISFASGSLAQTDMPPLPEDWRDVIDRMVSKERHSTLPTNNTIVDGDVLVSDTDGQIEGERQSQASTEFGTTRSFRFAPPSPCETCDGEAVPRPDSPTPWSRPVGKRRGQAEYRPPTPPLPRQHSRSPTSSAESPTVATSHEVSEGKMALMSLPKAIDLKPRSLPPIPTYNRCKPTISPPLPAPRPVRPLPDVRKVPLPTPPPSWSTHEYPISRCPSNRGFVSSEKVSPTLRSASPTQTPSPSTPYSEKNFSRSTQATSVKSGQHPHNPSVEQVRIKNEVSTVSKNLPARPGTLRQALARGLNGLKRWRALVASAILCRS